MELKRLAVLRGLPARMRYPPFNEVPLPPDVQIVIADGQRGVQVPVVERGGFGRFTFKWDGQETTVSGLPVFRA